MNVQRKIVGNGDDAGYDTDELLWFDKQAALLRTRDEAALDWDNLAEEVQEMGNKLRREVESRTTTILVHMIKFHVCILDAPRAGWLETIIEQRAQTRRVIEDAPSLLQHLEARFDKLYRKAEKQALLGLAAYEPANIERYLKAVEDLSDWTLDEVLDEDFFPKAPEDD